MPYKTRKQLLAWTPPSRDEDIIADGILVPNTKWIIFGDPKSWKTNIAMHTAYVLAQGKPWFGHKTRKVLPYSIQVEIPESRVQRRMKKYEKFENLNGQEVLFETISDLRIDTSYGEQKLHSMLKDVRDHYPVQDIVLILDNVLNLMTGNILTPQESGRFTRTIDIAKAKFNLTVILIHHARKPVYQQGELIDTGGGEAMGSGFGGWCDTEMRMKVTNPPPDGRGNRVRCDFTYHRHAEDYLPGFEILWNQATLHPRVISLDSVPEEEMYEEVTIRDLIE